jgi:hypothetical protein
MLKVHILGICSLCNSEGYLLIEESKDYQCHRFTRFAPVITTRVTASSFVGLQRKILPSLKDRKPKI